MNKILIRSFKGILLSILLISASGCSSFFSSATEDFGRNLKQVMINHNDPQTVADAIPAFLLLQEALLVDNPDNKATLIATVGLYSSYIALSEDQSEARKKRLSQKAFDLALKSACLHKEIYCSLNKEKYDDFTLIIQQTEADDLDTLHLLGTSWANWIQANKSDWSAIAQLAQVKYIMNHIAITRADYRQGEAFLYLAVLESILPPAMGGKPELAKQSFEKALYLSKNKNLMIHVLYAKHYARMLYDRELHDTLLTEVINADANQKGFTLSNTLAQQQANKLLSSANDYF